MAHRRARGEQPAAAELRVERARRVGRVGARAGGVLDRGELLLAWHLQCDQLPRAGEGVEDEELELDAVGRLRLDRGAVGRDGRDLG